MSTSGQVHPAGWESRTGRELFEFVTSGSRGWAKYYSEDGPTFLRIGNLDRGTVSLDLRDIQHVRPPAGAEGTRTRVTPGDVLVSITADIGSVALVPDGLGDAYINQHIALIRPRPGINARYLAWFIVSPDGQRQLAALERGATKKGLGLDDIRALDIPWAPDPVQVKIVAEIEKQFTRLDSGVEALKRLQAHLRRYRAAVLKDAFGGDWPRVAFRDLLREPLRNGHSAPKTDAAAGIRTLTLTAVTYGDFSESNTKVTGADPEKVKDLLA